MLADERPGAAKWLPAEQGAALQRVLDEEQQKIPEVRGYVAAFTDRRVILLAGMFLCFSASSYGLVMWLPGIVAEGSKQAPAMAGYLTAVPYFVAVWSMLAVSWASDRTLK